MLDVKLLRENLDQVKARMETRGAAIDWDAFTAIDRERRDALAHIERLKEKKNRLSGEIGKLKKSGADASALMREGEEVSAAIRSAEGPLAEVEQRFEQFMLTLPNLPHPTVPVGTTEADNKEVRRSSILPRKTSGMLGRSSAYSTSSAPRKSRAHGLRSYPARELGWSAR